MLEIMLLRHGMPTLRDVYLGTTDVPLSSEGKRQIISLAPDLSKVALTAVYSSPLRRCRQTLELLSLDMPCRFDPRLREVDFGRWEGRAFAEIAGSDPAEVGRWSENPMDFSFPEGEAFAAFAGRVKSCCESLYKLGEGRALIITHGGVIRLMICILLGLTLDNYLYFKVDYARLTTLQLHSEGGVLTGLNKGGEHG